MSEIVQAIILGIVQGLTEFLPVSSSGHLEIFKALFGEQYTPEESLMMTVMLHFATALSTVFIFRKEIWKLLVGSIQKEGTTDRRFILYIIISMIPAALIGVIWEDQIEAMFSGNLFWIGIALIGTGGILVLSDLKKITNKLVSGLFAFIIGIAQAIAIIPGISRSGATIGTSVLLGIRRERAATFSFLMVIPLIFGKIAKDLLDGSLLQDSINWVAISFGFLAAFATGALACTWMISWVKKSKLKYFAIYCFLVGLGVLIWSLER